LDQEYRGQYCPAAYQIITSPRPADIQAGAAPTSAADNLVLGSRFRIPVLDNTHSNSKTATLPTLQQVGSENLGPRTRSRRFLTFKTAVLVRVGSTRLSVVKNGDSKTPSECRNWGETCKDME
jgi:hypothetical protein